MSTVARGLSLDSLTRTEELAADSLAAEHDLDVLKPLTTDGARSIMRRL